MSRDTHQPVTIETVARSGLCVLCWINDADMLPRSEERYVWTPTGGTARHPYFYCDACQQHCREHGHIYAVVTRRQVLEALDLCENTTTKLPAEPNGWALMLGPIFPTTEDEDEDIEGEEWKRGPK
jgi:hypothetical protein